MMTMPRMTLRELIDSRAAAGARYAAAVMEFREALVSLCAIEQSLSNSLVGHAADQPGFAGDYPDLVTMRHAVYAPSIGGNLADDIKARLQEILNAFTQNK
jgi:hypothetical protein